MSDTWHTFPTKIQDQRAFITYNHSYAEIANKDDRELLLKVGVKIKYPNAIGMPTNDEIPSLNTLDEKLHDF